MHFYRTMFIIWETKQIFLIEIGIQRVRLFSHRHTSEHSPSNKYCSLILFSLFVPMIFHALKIEDEILCDVCVLFVDVMGVFIVYPANYGKSKISKYRKYIRFYCYISLGRCVYTTQTCFHWMSLAMHHVKTEWIAFCKKISEKVEKVDA